MINIEVFDLNLLRIDKKSYKNIDSYYIGYITIKKMGDYEDIYSVNPLHLIIGAVDGQIEKKKKKKNRSKYLVFDSTDENRKIFEKCTELWDGLKMKLRQLMVVKTVKW